MPFSPVCFDTFSPLRLKALPSTSAWKTHSPSAEVFPGAPTSWPCPPPSSPQPGFFTTALSVLYAWCVHVAVAPLEHSVKHIVSDK